MNATFNLWMFKQVLLRIPPSRIIDPACLHSQIPLKPYYKACVWFSLVHFCLVALITERRSFLRRPLPETTGSNSSIRRIQNYFQRYPGLPVPLNLMSYHHYTTAYTAAYVCAFSVIGALFAGVYNLKAEFPNAPVWLTACYKILAISVLSTTVLPLFLSITIGGLVHWFVGAAYSLFHVVLLALSLFRTSCIGIDELLTKAALNVPILISSFYLFCYFSYALITHRKNIAKNLWSANIDCQNSYILKNISHVRKLLLPAQVYKLSMKESTNQKTGFLTKLCRGLLTLFQPESGFNYPTGLIWSLTVGVILQYLLLTQVILRLNIIINNGKEYIWKAYPDLKKSFSQNIDLSNARNVHVIFYVPRNETKEYTKLEMAYVYYWIDVVWLCILLSICGALIMNVLNVFRVLKHYQELNKAIREGGFRAIPEIHIHLTPFLATRGTIIYPSYQVALMAWGFYLQILTYTAIAVFFAILVTLNAFTKLDFVNQFFKTWWPGILIMTVFGITQQLVVRFLFTQHRGKSYGFDNVRALQVYNFFASFYSIFFGLISGFGRVLYCPISSAVHLSRLDVSPLAKPIQSSDTGYVAFLGFLYTDLLKNNPTFRVFLSLLLTSAPSSKQVRQNLDKLLINELELFQKLMNRRAPKSSTREKVLEENELTAIISGDRKRVQRRWLLAFTLVRNPRLCSYRKDRVESGLFENYTLHGTQRF